MSSPAGKEENFHTLKNTPKVLSEEEK